MFKIGCTGGIGSGKSTAANFFADLGATVIDTDDIARSVVKPGSKALATIVEYFGSDILKQDGSLNRAYLRQLIFSNQEQKLWLEELLHPLIWQETIDQAENSKTPYCLLLVPLLIEQELVQDVDRVLVVDCPQEVQIQRVLARDPQSSAAEIKRIIAQQMDNRQRMQYADDILTNNDDLAMLQQQVKMLHKSYLNLAK